LPDEDPFKAKRGRKTFKVNYGLMWSEIVKESNSAALVFDSEFVSFLTTTIIEFSKYVILKYVILLTICDLGVSFGRFGS